MRLRALVLCVRSSASEMSLAACSWAKLPFHDSVPGYKCSPVGIFGSAKESEGARSLMCCDGFFLQFDHNCSNFLRVSVAYLMLPESGNIRRKLCFCKAPDKFVFLSRIT